MADLTKVNAIVKTFLRDEHMFKCVNSIMQFYPKIRIVLVDDGYSTPKKLEFYQQLRAKGHTVEDTSLAFDSGFGAKTNLALALCEREYVLMVNDDFLFDGNDDGVHAMATLLDLLPEAGMVCGTWCGNDYQGFLDRSKPGRIEETMFPRKGSQYDFVASNPHRLHAYKYVDLCAVYGILRRQVFTDGVRADARYKIGGEHGDFFMDIKDVGWKIAFTPDANINQIDDVQAHPDYQHLRLRQDWRQLYAKKHGHITYRYFDGREEKF